MSFAEPAPTMLWQATAADGIAAIKKDM